MPIVPVNYRGDDPFIPLTDVDKIDKDDFAPNTGGLLAAGRARVGTWLEFFGNNGLMEKPAVGVETDVSCAPTWSDYDSTGALGHPDSFRLGLLTMLIGSHRGRTRYYSRAVSPVVAGSVGAPLTVYPLVVGEVATINTEAGAVICEIGDGVLGLAGTPTNPHLAFCLRGPINGYIEYYKY